MVRFLAQTVLTLILVVLVLTSLFTGGLEISGIMTWVLAPLVIWLTTILAGVVLPLVLFKKTLGKGKGAASKNA